MKKKIKVLNIATIISSIITILLLFTCIIGNKEFWGITILFISITQMLIAINQYEFAKNMDAKRYRRLGDICMITALGVLAIAMFLL